MAASSVLDDAIGQTFTKSADAGEADLPPMLLKTHDIRLKPCCYIIQQRQSAATEKLSGLQEMSWVADADPLVRHPG